MAMFEGQRYLTKGVKEQVSIPLQITLWSMIEKLEIEVDYLQIFEIEQLANSQLSITHKQEEPEYQSITILPGVIQSNKIKIYVIDDHEYATMLLADEY